MREQNCPRCDRPLPSQAESDHIEDLWPDPVEACKQHPRTCLGTGTPQCIPVDWRARALAAEVDRDRAKAWHPRMNHCSFCGKAREQALYLISGPVVFICDECVGLCVDILDTKLLRVWDYEAIARRALVAGLAECDRLRLCGNVAPEYAGMTVVLGGSPEHEQAIRADAAREERDAIVRWLLSLQSDDYSAGGLAGRINNDAHAALRAGGGGSDATR